MARIHWTSVAYADTAPQALTNTHGNRAMQRRGEACTFPLHSPVQHSSRTTTPLQGILSSLEMFPKVLVFLLAFFAVLITATTTYTEHPPPSPTPTNKLTCSQAGFNPLCCNTALTSNPAPPAVGYTFLLGLLGIIVTPALELVGLGCGSIVGSTCSGTVLCCENNIAGSLIGIGCINIII